MHQSELPSHYSKKRAVQPNKGTTSLTYSEGWTVIHTNVSLDGNHSYGHETHDLSFLSCLMMWIWLYCIVCMNVIILYAWIWLYSMCACHIMSCTVIYGYRCIVFYILLCCSYVIYMWVGVSVWVGVCHFNIIASQKSSMESIFVE